MKELPTPTEVRKPLILALTRTASTEKLHKRTEELRAIGKVVNGLLRENPGLIQLTDQRIMDQEGEEYQSNLLPSQRLVELNNGIADATREAAGHNFDLLVYPYAGTDIAASVALSDNIVTLDSKDIFDNPNIGANKQTVNTLMETLLYKLILGTYLTHVANLGFAQYAMELSLLGVDFDTFQVVEEKRFGGETMTTVQFTLPDGRRITHTNFSNTTLRDRFSRRRPKDSFVRYELATEIGKSQNPCFLAKGGFGHALKVLASKLTDGAVVLADSKSEIDDLANSGIQLEDIKTESVTLRLAQLDETNELTYGYTPDLTKVNMVRVAK